MEGHHSGKFWTPLTLCGRHADRPVVPPLSLLQVEQVGSTSRKAMNSWKPEGPDVGAS